MENIEKIWMVVKQSNLRHMHNPIQFIYKSERL